MTSNIASKDVEVEDQREIYLYPGSKSKSEVWRYFGFYRKAAGPPTKNTFSQHYKSNQPTTMSSVRHVVLFVFDLQHIYRVSDVMLHTWKFILHVLLMRNSIYTCMHSGLFGPFYGRNSAIFSMANHIFFSPNFCPTIPNSKVKKYVVK